ncbi:MAG TPA: site-specific integrase, partial [Dehalococcoidia bacterium]|nr:site-specific integrase [Dehalococcoidia bacterium]
HTCAALMVAQGAHPKMIQAHMGHSSISITLDVYGHLMPSLGRDVADALGRERAENVARTVARE